VAVEGCEYLSDGGTSRHAASILDAMRAASSEASARTTRYAGRHRWLMLWGVGRPQHAAAWRQHAGPVAMWDLGYLGRTAGYYRVGLNHWHPTPEQLDRTPNDPARFQQIGVELREDGDPAGPIVLVGMGPKSRVFVGDQAWEARTLRELQREFPGRRIVFRPKPGRPAPALGCEIADGPIGEVLRGASLVVCRHSNVAVDAAVAGVPARCEDGIARWLRGRPFNEETRRDFLARVAWWQWKPDEAGEAWRFLRCMA
jgi:hypothetical protein